MKHSFLGDLIPGEKYELFNGDIITLSTTDTHYVAFYLTERGTGKTDFHIMSPDKLRRTIKDFY